MPKCRGEYGRTRNFILVPPDAEIDTEANALLESTWTGNIEADEASRWYPLPVFFRYEPSREDHVYTQGDFGDKYSVREGYADGVAYYLNPSICFQKKLRDFNGQAWKAYEVTEKGFIKGWSQDGTKMLPFTMFFNVEAETPATGEEGRLMKIRVYPTESYEWEEYGVVIDPINDAISTWDPRDLEGLLDATVEVYSSSSTELVVDVQTYCDDTPVTGLVVTDFVLQDDTPETETINSATESSTVDGRYTLDVTTLGDDNYTINLKEPSAMTTDGYQAGTAASFTISS